MNTSIILERAKDYIKAEKNAIFRKEIEELVANKDIDELKDRFYMNLAFGTGGLRGIIGGGFNRINSYTIQRATQGLANYISKVMASSESSAVIAYDNRNYSNLFALEAAKVLAGNGIKTYLFTDLRPTPELSFAVRYLKATTGIVVTASHNPPEYNGYKCYWNDGCQVLPPHDTAIIKEAKEVNIINILEKDDAIRQELIVLIDKEIDEPFIKMVTECAIRPELFKQYKDTKIIFTPLHGTGAKPVANALSAMGLDPIFVDEQREPDGNFPTVKSPNPEEKEALQMAIEKAKVVKADLVLATDPDADRLGIAVPDENGEYVLITGNQLGTLLSEYIFSSKKELGTLPAKPVFIKTIVTTELQRKIAEDFGATAIDVLTGFKYIGEKIRELEMDNNGYTYVFGGEESYGYLVNDLVRDKDAVSAATLTVELVLYLRSKGSSILKYLDEIWDKYGYYQEILISKVFKGIEGKEKIALLMNRLRNNPPKKIGNIAVSKMKDFNSGIVLDFGNEQKNGVIDLPSSNVIQFVLEDGSVFTARPSGTEPKIKFYASVCESSQIDLCLSKTLVQNKIVAIKATVDTLIK